VQRPVALAIAAGASRPSAGRDATICGKFSRIQGMSIGPSTTTWATCTPTGPSSRAIDCASARSANFAPANAAKPGPPRRLAVAPVNRIELRHATAIEAQPAAFRAAGP
jgi:hypothetical protein